ncbi:MAG TPA: energy transducer TonB [Bryobacteraceae bacterium]|nr:energy transducer TonB [Bryobacteraceae bacterium]
MLAARVVAADYEHDVALLQAVPNPFQGPHNVTFLKLSAEMLSRGQTVLSDSLRSPDVENASSLDAPQEEPSTSQMLGYDFNRDQGAPDSEVMLVSQDVEPGQSGSPLLAANSGGVVGVIVGRWLRPTVLPSSTGGAKRLSLSPGVALRIHYAINLLQQNHVRWYTAAAAVGTGIIAENLAAAHADAGAKIQLSAAAGVATDAPQPQEPQLQQASGYMPPQPLSVVGTPYPPQALFGGEVFLDALVDDAGKLSDVRVVHGEEPFLSSALGAVDTWSFLPAQLDGHAVDARIGIVFQFPTSFLPRMTTPDHTYAEPAADLGDHGAVPVFTEEPVYPANSVAEGSVELYGAVDAQGHVDKTTVLQDVGSLTETTEEAVGKWQFAPGIQGGKEMESGVLAVVTFRRPSI